MAGLLLQDFFFGGYRSYFDTQCLSYYRDTSACLLVLKGPSLDSELNMNCL